MTPRLAAFLVFVRSSGNRWATGVAETYGSEKDGDVLYKDLSIERRDRISNRDRAVGKDVGIDARSVFELFDDPRSRHTL